MPNHDGWIPLDEWCEKYNDRKNTCHKRVTDGAWIRGEHISAPDGGECFVHEKRCRDWMATKRKLV